MIGIEFNLQIEVNFEPSEEQYLAMRREIERLAQDFADQWEPADLDRRSHLP